MMEKTRPRTLSEWGQRQRIEFIEFRLRWEGRVNRSDLMKYFGISVPQASLDLSRYIEIAPENISYDRTQKAYFPSDDFVPVVTPPESSAYLDLLMVPGSPPANFVGWRPPVGRVPHPSRNVDASVLRSVLAAIRNRQKIEVTYQSMTRPKPTRRWISPHAIGYDGFRWHTRAYCHEHCSFRDFVFARILKIQRVQASSIDSTGDSKWEQTIDLVLAPNPKLTDGQRRAVALDYGMKRGRIVLSTRRALAFYVLRQLGLDDPDSAPRAQHIILVNREQIEPLIDSHE